MKKILSVLFILPSLLFAQKSFVIPNHYASFSISTGINKCLPGINTYLGDKLEAKQLNRFSDYIPEGGIGLNYRCKLSDDVAFSAATNFHFAQNKYSITREVMTQHYYNVMDSTESYSDEYTTYNAQWKA